MNQTFCFSSGPNSSVDDEREVFNNSLNSSDSTEAKIHTVVNVETPYNPSDQSNKWEEEGNILVDELESLKDKYGDEEIMGIITMEDVMEELLQVTLSSQNSFCISAQEFKTRRRAKNLKAMNKTNGTFLICLHAVFSGRNFR